MAGDHASRRAGGPAAGASRERLALALLLEVLVVSALFGASIIHGAWTVLHFDEWIGAGLFFLGLAAAQMLGALALAAMPGRTTYLAIIVVNLGTLLLWAVSRSAGMPVGPEAGRPAPVGAPDLVASLFELLTVLGLLTLLRWPSAAARGATPASGMPARPHAATVGIPVCSLLLTCVAVVPAATGHVGEPNPAPYTPGVAETSGGPGPADSTDPGDDISPGEENAAPGIANTAPGRTTKRTESSPTANAGESGSTGRPDGHRNHEHEWEDSRTRSAAAPPGPRQ